MQKPKNTQKPKLPLTLLLLLLLLLTLLNPLKTQAQSYTIDDINQVKATIESHYYTELEEDKLYQDAIKGMVNSLDPYSRYYSQEEFQSFQEEISNTRVGIGLYIIEDNGKIKILAPLEGSPAKAAGIKAADQLLEIDGKPTQGKAIEKVLEELKGPANTRVKLKLKRGKETLTLEVKRQALYTPTVSSKKLDSKTGYIKLDSFSSQSHQEMKKALAKLDKEGTENLILDLRDNPGGYLTQAVKIAELFIPEGPIVHVQYKDRTVTHSSHNKKPNAYQILVLVNENSASASEILAAAIQDTGRGRVVGERSFGKTQVQQIIPLKKGGLKLTTAQYLTPKGRNINRVGLEPDIIIRWKGKTQEEIKAMIELF